MGEGMAKLIGVIGMDHERERERVVGEEEEGW